MSHFYMNRTRLLLLCMLLMATISIPLCGQTWLPAEAPPDHDLQALLPHPLDRERIIVASSRQIFEGVGTGTWKNLWRFSGNKIRIQKLSHFQELPDRYFVLSSSGAYQTMLKDFKTQEVYQGQGEREKSVLSIAVSPENPNHWFLGTAGGLFESDDAGTTWFRFTSFSKEPASVLRFADGLLYVGAGKNLYASSDNAHFQHVFSLHGSEPVNAEEKDAGPFEEESEPVDSFAIYDLVIPQNHETLWLGTEQGVFESRSHGESWRRLSRSGLRSVEIRHLAYDEKTRALFAGTPKGVYRFMADKNRWEELYQGLAQTNVRGLAVMAGKKTTLLAATEGGLSRFPILPDRIQAPGRGIQNTDILPLFHVLLRLEPSAREIQQAVIRYGNMKNWKTKRWQAGSRLAALLPAFSFGRDFSQSNNIDVDRGSTSERDQFIAGPAEIDEGWDMDVSWDLGDFIYSSDQTSIDSREKLMVELRNDFLAEATRLYYERRRLQIEIIFAPPVSEQEHLERLIRMDEFTALLDAMTDGVVSRRLEEIYKKNPGLEQLWAFRRNTQNLTQNNAKANE